MRRRVVGIGVFLQIFVIAGCIALSARPAASADEKPAPVSIAIDNFSFTPNEVTISRGTAVTWVNHDDVPHTVVSKDQKFRSKALDTNDQFSFTFADAGTYVYFCSVHPVMTGKVIVK